MFFRINILYDFWSLSVVADLKIATNHRRSVAQTIMYQKLKVISIAANFKNSD